MSELTGAFGLQYAALITARVQAYNLKGWGSLSSVNTVGALAEVVPGQVNIPRRGSLTTETESDVEWSALTTFQQLGGLTCTILSYNL